MTKNSTLGGHASFPTTEWTSGIDPAKPDSPAGLEARNLLCKAYWYPVYAFIRRNGFQPPEAQDMTQEVLAKLITPTDLDRVGRAKGRFRSYVLGAVKHHLINHKVKRATVKHGGGIAIVSLDAVDAEGRYLNDPSHEWTPDVVLDYTWAQSVLAAALQRLEQTYRARGKSALFDDLRVFIDGEQREVSYEEIADRHALELNTAKSEIRRIRTRYARELRDVVAETVEDEAEIDSELAELLRILSERPGI